MITVVSGIPRSGTSLAMQMLKAGGMSILYDDTRKEDENNTQGYYEYDKVKGLMKDASWIDKAEEKAVKIIAPLILYLPDNFQYAVIFMERNMEEILLSQNKMLARSGRQARPSNIAQLGETFSLQIKSCKKFMENKKNFRILHLSYKDMIADAPTQVQRVAAFLSNIRMDTEKMATVVIPELYHTKILS